MGWSLRGRVMAAMGLLGVLASGCAPTAYGLDPGVERAATNVLPPPTTGDLISGSRAYVVGPFDQLEITMANIDDPVLQSHGVQVEVDGSFDYPYIGTVEALGRSRREIADEIEARLRGRFVVDPQVFVNLEETASQTVTVVGEVTRSGNYPIVGGSTLLRTIALAGGLTDEARRKEVVIIRNAGDQRYIGIYNLTAIGRGNYADPEIYANDIVVVDESATLRFLREIVPLVSILSTPLILIERSVNR